MKANKLNDLGLLLLRLFLAAILIYYGSQKMLGAFGGAGLSGTLSSFEQKNHFPQWLTMLAIVSEFCGSIAVAIGLLTRLAAFGITCTMATAAWSNLSHPGGVYKDAHLPLALCGMALALIFTGAGSYAVEAALLKGRKRGGGGFSKGKPS
jgi:putative oxidoreductase